MNYCPAVSQTDFPRPSTRGAIAGHVCASVEQTIVGSDGRILAQADPGPGEKVVVAPIDIAALRAERSRRMGRDAGSHVRSELHRYLGRDWIARSEAMLLAKDAIERCIRDAET
jgi:hypothetical protein